MKKFSKKNRVVLPLATLLVLSSSFTSAFAATDTFEQGAQFYKGDYKLTSPQPVVGQWTNNSAFNGSEEGGLKWRYTLPYKDPATGSSQIKQFFYQGTLDADGTYYIGNQDGRVRALNPDGSLKWEYLSGGTTISPGPTIANDNTLYFTNGPLTALNPNGTLKWKFSASTSFNSRSIPLLLEDGTIIVAARENTEKDYLYAVNSDGTLKWKTSTDMEGNLTGKNYITKDGNILVTTTTTTTTYVYVYDLSGKLVNTTSYNGSYGNYTLANNGNLLMTMGKNLIEIDSLTGKTIYTLTLPDTINASPTVGKDGAIYVSYYKGLDAYNSDYTKKWTKNFASYVYQVTLDSDGTLYVPASYDGFYALNPDGTQKWKETINVNFGANAPSIDKKGIVYMPGTTGGNNYEVLAFGKENNEPETPTTTTFELKSSQYVYKTPEDQESNRTGDIVTPSTVTVTEKQGDWYYITTTVDGKTVTGWINPTLESNIFTQDITVLKKYTYVYAKPDTTSTRNGPYDSQTYTTKEKFKDESGNTWYKVVTENGDRYLSVKPYQVQEGNENKKFPVTLTKPQTNMYDSPSISSGHSALGPQTVTATRRDGDWMQIESWAGLKWVTTSDRVLVGKVEETSKMVSIPNLTQLYDYPFEEAPNINKLGTQTIPIKAEWNNPDLESNPTWYKISTWMGDKWIKKP